MGTIRNISLIPKESGDLDLFEKIMLGNDTPKRGNEIVFRGTMTPEGRGNYCRVPGWVFWEKEEIQELKDKFAYLNDKTEDVNFIFAYVSEFERDTDRDYPAAFAFYVDLKK